MTDNEQIFPADFFCKLLGHRWRYKNYTNAIKMDGKKFLFTSARRCKRCDKYEYKYSSWVGKEFISPEDRKSFLTTPNSLQP